MPRHKISQREAREAIKERDALRKYVNGELRAPAGFDPHCLGAVVTVTLSDYGRGKAEGAQFARGVFAGRLEGDKLTLFRYRLPKECGG